VGGPKQSLAWLLPYYNLSLQLSSTNNLHKMSAQWYPEGYWADHFHPVSQDKPVQAVGGGEAQEHAEPTQYNPQMYSTALYEMQNGAGASGKSLPVRWLGPR